jgi:Cu-Zn family superoxide dismutase
MRGMKHLLTLAFALTAVACGGKSKPDTTPVPETTTEAAPPAEAPPATPAEAPPAPPAPPPAPKTATATLAATAKSKVTGTVTFKEADGGLEVTATLENLTPGDHAWHVHEKGDCSAPDAMSAGGHFNPENHQHGAPDAEQHHAGDFGNLTAGKDGKATKTFTMKGITLGTDAASVVGKGFIVHEKKDDFKTQPTGNAGGRVACGVIKLDS